MKRAFLLAAAVLAATVLPAAAQQSPQWHFMFGDRFVDAIVANPAANAALNGARPLINIETIESPSGQAPRFPSSPPANVPKAWNAIYMYRWASEQQMATDMPHVPSWITACMYDNEDAQQYPLTPQEERVRPSQWIAKAAQVCHQAHKTFLPSSGVRQFRRQDQSDNDNVYRTASDWDGYSAQTQMYEDNLQEFRSRVDDFYQHVHSVNPNAKFFIVGVGDLVHNQLAPNSMVEAAIRSLPPGTYVWLNYGPHPRQGIPARPDLVAQVIADLAK